VQCFFIKFYLVSEIAIWSVDTPFLPSCEHFALTAQVFSNLPGPTERLVFCGEVVTGMQIMFPNLIPQVQLAVPVRATTPH